MKPLEIEQRITDLDLGIEAGNVRPFTGTIQLDGLPMCQLRLIPLIRRGLLLGQAQDLEIHEPDRYPWYCESEPQGSTDALRLLRNPTTHTS